MEVKSVETKPIAGQKTGTSGLRKKVTVFQSNNYLQNWIQSLFNSLPSDKLQGSTLVLGGDGRFWVKEAIQIIIQMAAANGVGKLLVGQNGIFSTPAVSTLIRKLKTFGGIILTASHNPGGPDADFGIKFNSSNGGPAPESLTEKIYEQTLIIKEYKIATLENVDLSKIGKTQFGSFVVEVIDSADDYVSYLQEIFNFDLLRSLIARKDFHLLFDSLNGVTGAYTKRIFIDKLGAPENSVMNASPKEDFGGLHPDPNLTVAVELIQKMSTNEFQFGAASDGDGDRNMILGANFFVNPSDSVAIIAANALEIPYFKDGLKALARSMPTSGALDLVAKKLGVPFYEVPTGWKFFGNIMDHFEAKGFPHSVICGEESFGTGSDHIREKDGIWAVLCWLSILANKNSDPEKPLVTIEDIVKAHWKEFGRNHYTRYDYEEVDAVAGDNLMKHLESLLPTLKGQTFLDGKFKVSIADQFSYVDPFDNSVTKNQGVRIIGEDGSRLIFRLSGTGSSGATIRMYIEKYEPAGANYQENALSGLIQLGIELSNLESLTGRKTPSVIT